MIQKSTLTLLLHFETVLGLIYFTVLHLSLSEIGSADVTLGLVSRIDTKADKKRLHGAIVSYLLMPEDGSILHSWDK